MYDLFFIVYDNEEIKSKIRSRFPLAKFCVVNDTTKMQEVLESAQKRSMTKMFWIVEPGFQIKENFYFDYEVPSWDQIYVHVFKEERSDNYDGVYLIPKAYHITKNESDYMFFLNKKEISQIASVHNYDKFFVNNYNDYLEAKKKSNTNLFYVVFSDLIILDTFKFDYVVDKHMRHLTHVFKNGNCYDGLFITSKKRRISENEFKNRFLINRTEIDIKASNPAPFDIVFISYNEPNADKNFKNLIERFPNAKRIHGVDGIHQAHREAANLVTTPMFWVVDGDAKIVENFNFNYQVPFWDFNMVYVWRSKNPVNDLEYGYGGVKLLPTELTKYLSTSTVDMTTSISSKFKLVDEISNISDFNTDAFSAWRSAFRECVKLSSKIISEQVDAETLERLEVWCTEGEKREYGTFAIRGAIMGRDYGSKYKDDPQALRKINDWNWLTETFQKEFGDINV